MQKIIPTSVVCVIFFLFFSVTFAQDNWKLKAGLNLSWFEQASDISPGIGYIVEINKAFSFKNFGYFALGLNLQSRSSVLNGRSVKFNWPPDDSDIYIADIQASVGYIEIPVLLGLKFSSRYFTLSPYAGCSVSFPLTDNTSIDRKDLVYSNDQISQDFNSDYTVESEIFFDHNKADLILNVGLEIQVKRYLIDFRYIHDLRDELWVHRIGRMNYRTVGLNFIIGYQL